MTTRYDAFDDELTFAAARKQQSFFFFATVALAATISILGIAGGFVYGDYYGRRHAQYENPELRQYYAGQCYSYIDNQLKKTIKSAFEKNGNKKEQTERLDDIRNLIINLQMDVGGIGQTKRPNPPSRETPRKKVASVAS
ncbi:MAG: hypothetical protein H7249_09935 [Chitinophagaceae bacterium]|nr:hypothetical protein [Oligoflexus sp.]